MTTDRDSVVKTAAQDTLLQLTNIYAQPMVELIVAEMAAVRLPRTAGQPKRERTPKSKRVRLAAAEVDGLDLTLLQHARAGGDAGLQVGPVAKTLGRATPQIATRLRSLVQLGHLQMVGSKRGARYVLTASGAAALEAPSAEAAAE